MQQDEFFMSQALMLAHQAAALGEVPVGALLVTNGKIVSTAYNRREIDQNALGHAELLLLAQACRVQRRWRLEETTLYVTLEPCPMCAGAIINARIPRVVFGAFDPKAGCFGSVCQFTTMGFNHHVEITPGVLAEQSAQLLSSFFYNLRTKRRTQNDIT